MNTHRLRVASRFLALASVSLVPLLIVHVTTAQNCVDYSLYEIPVQLSAGGAGERHSGSPQSVRGSYAAVVRARHAGADSTRRVRRSWPSRANAHGGAKARRPA